MGQGCGGVAVEDRFPDDSVEGWTGHVRGWVKCAVVRYCRGCVKGARCVKFVVVRRSRRYFSPTVRGAGVWTERRRSGLRCLRATSPLQSGSRCPLHPVKTSWPATSTSSKPPEEVGFHSQPFLSTHASLTRTYHD